MGTTNVTETAATAVADIPGWFTWSDQQAFAHFLTTAGDPEPGDVVELGVYMGKSAAFTGFFLREDERFTVCDLFGGSAQDDANDVENDRSYADLERGRFEEHYRSVHADLPVVVEGPSSDIVDHVEPGSARFVHVDASHNYNHVVTDVVSSRQMLRPDGVVVFDDIRSPHTPGVSAAVWGAVARGEVRPLLLTPNKLYATYGDGVALRAARDAWLAEFGRFGWDVHEVEGADLVRVWPTDTAAPAPPAPPAPASDAELLRRLNRRLRRVEKKVDALAQRGPNPIARRVRRVLRPRG